MTVTPMTDETCMAQVRSGDLHGLIPLYDRHHHQIHDAARTLAGDHLADGLTEEVFGRFLALLLADGQISVPVRYFLFDILRECHHLRLQQSVLVPRARSLRFEEDSQALAEALRSLPEDWRHSLWLRTIERLDVPGVAAALALSLRATHRLCRSAEIALRTAYIAAKVAPVPRGRERGERG